MKHDHDATRGTPKRRLLLVELNEINLDIVKSYLDSDLLSLPGFEQLLARGVVRTSSEAEYEHLEPWVQWVSAHSGLTYAEHGVFRLGDIVGSKVPQIFEQLEAQGLSVGAVSPMNAENRLRNPAYFIPDPWTQTPSDSSFWSRKLTVALGQAVNDNASARLTPATLLTLLGALGRFSTPKRWKRYITLATGSRGRPWRKALFLDLLLADIHQRLWCAHRPDFSVLFLNAGAHIQHHYLFNSKALAQNKLENPAWYCDKRYDPIAEMLLIYDDILQELLARDDLDVLVATGLTQVPYDRVKFYYRLRDHASFLEKIGLVPSSITPLMTRDFVIDFKDRNATAHAAARLGGIVVANDGAPLFSEIEDRGNGLFVTLTYPKEITDTTCIIVDGQTMSLKEHVAFVAVKNGMHSGTGFAVLPPSIASEALADGEHVRGLARVIVEHFGASDQGRSVAWE